MDEHAILPILRHDLLTGPHGQDRDAVKLETMFEVTCRHTGRTASVGELAQENSLSSGEDADLGEFANYLQALADTALIRFLPWPVLNSNHPRDAIKVCLADHALRASWLRERVTIAPDAVDASPELTTLAGHIAQSVLGAAASVIHGLDTDRVPTAAQRTQSGLRVHGRRPANPRAGQLPAKH